MGMNKLLIAIVLLLGPVVLNSLTSCETCMPTPYQSAIANYRLYAQKLTDATAASFLADTLSSKDSVTYKQVALLIMGEERRLALSAQQSGELSAVACSETFIAVDSIRSLSVTSSQPYATLSANQDISASFTIGPSAYSQEPLSDFTANHPQPAQLLYLLQLQQPPKQAGWYSFSVYIQLKSGQLYNLMTKPVFIKS